jgi:uncharacterized RDD family membrane protein YckC
MTWQTNVSSLSRPSHANLATTWKRVIGYLIDAIIVGLVVGAIVGMLEVADSPQWLQALVAFIGFYGYFTYLEGTSGQTLGKRVMKTRVVTVSGRPLTMADSAIRNILRIVDMLFGGLVGLLLIIFNSNKQRVGDMAAKTLVIDA